MPALATVDNKPALGNGCAWALLTLCQRALVLLCQVDKGEAKQTTGGDGSEWSEWNAVHCGDWFSLLCNPSNGRAGPRAARAWIVAVLKVGSELYGSPVDN